MKVFIKNVQYENTQILYDKQQIFLNTCIRVSFKRVLLLRAWKNVDDHGYQWNNGQYVISLILSRSARKVSSSGSINLLCKLPCKISTVSAVLRCSDEVVNTTERRETYAHIPYCTSVRHPCFVTIDRWDFPYHTRTRAWVSGWKHRHFEFYTHACLRLYHGVYA